MPEKLNGDAEKEIRRVAEDAIWESVEIVEVKTLVGEANKGTIMLRVEGNDISCINAFAGMALEKFLEEGFMPVSIAAEKDGAIGWFKPVDIGITL